MMKDWTNGLFGSRTAFIVLIAGLMGLAGCGAVPAGERQADPVAPVTVLMPEASGTEVYADEGVTLDASNKDQGYVMIKTEETEPRLKTRVEKGDGAYNYDQPQDGDYETYPLQMGSGEYGVQVLEQVEGNMYARVFKQGLTVTLSSEEVPYLYPNQFVSYTESDAAVQKAAELSAGLDEAAAVQKMYRFVADKIAYDYDKAANVASGYLPVPDETLETKKGICFDYAALFACMLRSRGIPAKLVIGYVAPDNLYHAWNEAYIGGEWKFFDATLDGEGRKEADYLGERVY